MKTGGKSSPLTKISHFAFCFLSKRVILDKREMVSGAKNYGGDTGCVFKEWRFSAVCVLSIFSRCFCLSILLRCGIGVKSGGKYRFLVFGTIFAYGFLFTVKKKCLRWLLECCRIRM